MARRHPRRQGTLIAAAALAAVVGLATPAVAADSSTSVQASPSTATVGSDVTLTATVTCPEDPGVRSLGVTFFDDDNSEPLGTVTLDANNQAALEASFSTTGTHTITAAYNGNQSGDAGCGASHSTTTVTVTEGPTPPNPGPCLLLCTPNVGTSLVNFGNGNISNNIGNEVIKSHVR